jgi:hypothetical protein
LKKEMDAPENKEERGLEEGMDAPDEKEEKGLEEEMDAPGTKREGLCKSKWMHLRKRKRRFGSGNVCS